MKTKIMNRKAKKLNENEFEFLKMKVAEKIAWGIFFGIGVCYFLLTLYLSL
jgi:hypothetical protein